MEKIGMADEAFLLAKMKKLAEQGGGGEAATHIADIVLEHNLTLTSVSNATMPTGEATGRFDYELPADMVEKWKVSGLSKWEFHNGANRIPAIPVYIFSMENGTKLRMGFKTCGTQSIVSTKQHIAVILERR